MQETKKLGKVQISLHSRLRLRGVPLEKGRRHQISGRIAEKMDHGCDRTVIRNIVGILSV